MAIVSVHDDRDRRDLLDEPGLRERKSQTVGCNERRKWGPHLLKHLRVGDQLHVWPTELRRARREAGHERHREAGLLDQTSAQGVVARRHRHGSRGREDRAKLRGPAHGRLLCCLSSVDAGARDARADKKGRLFEDQDPDGLPSRPSPPNLQKCLAYPDFGGVTLVGQGVQGGSTLQVQYLVLCKKL